MLYLTGCSTSLTRAARRPDLGLLATPASGIYAQRRHYPAGWAADNACFAAPMPDGTAWPDPVAHSPAHTPTARAVRYGTTPEHVRAWRAWLDRLDPTACRFVTAPDVVGDYAATYERSAEHVTRLTLDGWPLALVAQDGIEHDRYVWRSTLDALTYNAARTGRACLFLGGSTAWKLGPAAAALVAEARRLDLDAHLGRVNSLKRLRHADAIGCTSADGTYVAFGPTTNAPRLFSWLDQLADAPPLFAMTNTNQEKHTA